MLLSPSMLSGVSPSRVAEQGDISPDSGHRELSTDSLSTGANTQSDVSWHSALAAASTTYDHQLPSTSLSSPTYPIISPCDGGHDTSHLMDKLNPTAVDVCGRVLRNAGVPASDVCNGSMHGIALDKSLSVSSHGDSQLFVNEDSMLAGYGDSSVFSHQ